MASKRYSLESGIEADEFLENSDSARKSFFSSYIPQLENVFRQDCDDLDDPTLDLDCMMNKDLAIRVPSPIKHKKHTSEKRKRTSIACHQEKKSDPSLGELDLIVREISKRSDYGNKLTDILISGLKNTLGMQLFTKFINDGLPMSWIPIIKMNNDNKPYVEFLLKSDDADETPMAQLPGYTLMHMSGGRSVFNYIRERARAIQTTPHRPLRLQEQKTNSVRPHQTYNHMSCSTPLSRKASQPKRSETLPSTRDDLNDSKRILPTRACKSRSVGLYKTR